MMTQFPYEQILTKATIRALSDEYKQRGLAIYLLYLIKPGLLQNESFSSHMEALWREAEMEGEEMARILTQFVLTTLEIYYSQTFRRM